MTRPAIAFLVAPLAVPILLVPYLNSLMPAQFWFVVALCFSAITAYAGTFLFGIPAYLFLQARKWTAFWIAPVLGFIAAGLAWTAFAALFGLSLGSDLSGVKRVLSNVSGLRDVLWPFGPLGAVVGSLLWLIARPDRA